MALSPRKQWKKWYLIVRGWSSRVWDENIDIGNMGPLKKFIGEELVTFLQSDIYTPAEEQQQQLQEPGGRREDGGTGSCKAVKLELYTWSPPRHTEPTAARSFYIVCFSPVRHGKVQQNTSSICSEHIKPVFINHAAQNKRNVWS